MIRPDVFADAAALAGLTQTEMLTAYRYFCLDATAADIARADGVTKRTIFYRIESATSKLATLPAEHLARLGIDPPKPPTEDAP